MLSWGAGAVTCRVVAAAGHYVLLKPERHFDARSKPSGTASLTYLDGMVPMGWDGEVEPGAHPGELRFRAGANQHAPDRRSSVRVPIFAAVRVVCNPSGEPHAGQLLDVSAGGLRFRHSMRLAVGDLVRVMCALPEGIVIDADGVVRASEVGIAAVEYTTMHGTPRDVVGRWTVDVLRSSISGQG